MANRKIKSTDIADPKVFAPVIKEAKELLVVFEEIKGQLIEIGKENAKLAKTKPLKGYKEVEEKEEAIRKTKKAVSELEKVERSRIRVQEKLDAFEAESVKRNEQLKLQLSERRKALKNEIKETTTVTGKYGQLNARLARLRKEYKETAIEQGRSSESAKKLKEEVIELSKALEELDRDVRQQHREIGRYEKAFKKLNSTMGKLGIISLVIGAFGALKDAFTSNQEGADNLAKIVGRVTISFRVFVQRLIVWGKSISAFFKRIGINFNIFVTEAKLFFAELPALMGGSAKKAAELSKKLETLKDEQASLTKIMKDGTTEAFKGMGEEIEELVRKNDILIDQTTRYRKLAITLKEEISGLAREQALLQQAADDNTTALEDQLEANEKLLAVSEQLSARNVQLARNEVALAALRVETNKGSLEAREAYGAALVALAEAESEAEIVAAENATKRREIERDNIELDLDQLIDLADRRKTINETIAKDESLSLERRGQAIEDAISDIEKSFRAQAAKIQEGLEVSFNIDDLINETDTVKLNERIKALGLDEIRQNRLREIIQERIQATEDLRGAQSELDKVVEKSISTTDDIIAQEAILSAIEEGRLEVGEALEKLEERRLELAIKNTEALLGAAEDGSTEQLELQQKLNNLKLEMAQAGADEEVEIEEDKNKQLLEAAKETQSLINDEIEDRLDRQIAATEREIDAAKEREDQLRELAAQGVQSAQESLAVEQQRRAELELQRANQEKKKALLQLQVAALDVYGNLVASGKSPGQALAETSTSTSLLRKLIESIPGFMEGTELVESDMRGYKIHDGDDGYLARFDGKERIMPGHLNAMIPRTMSNADLASLAAGKGAPETAEIRLLRREVRAVKSAIQNQELYKGMDFDAIEKAITFRIEAKNKLLRKHRNIGSVIG